MNSTPFKKKESKCSSNAFGFLFEADILAAFYLSLVVTLFYDNKRKDFNEQVIHHIATLSLLVLSYVSQFTRVGALVMLYHDCSDVFLELAKLFNYAKIKNFPDVIFGIFMILFFLTRLVLYPRLIYTTCITEITFTPFLIYWIIIGFLMTLQASTSSMP